MIEISNFSSVKDTFRPILKDEVLGTSVLANTDIFSSDLIAPADGFWIVQIITDTAGYPILKIKPSGSASYLSAGLNESSNLTANSWYEFWLTARENDSLNIQFSAAATISVRVFFVKGS